MIITNILGQHVEGTVILSAKRAAQLSSDIATQCENVRNMLSELPRHGHVDLASEDRELSVGENLAHRS